MSSQILPPARPPAQGEGLGALTPVVDGMKDLVFGSPSLFDDRGAFVAAPAGPNPFVNAVRDLTRLRCRVWAASDKSGHSSRVTAYNASVCNPYLEGLNEKPVDGSLGPEVPGGQCAGTYYFVTMRFYHPTTGAVTGTAVYEGFGPVTISPSGNQAPGVGGGCVSGQRYYPGKALFFNGVGRVSFGGGCAVRQTWEVVSVVPRGSEPNNCGNSPVVVNPPGRVVPTTPIPPTIPITLPGVGTVNVGVTINASGNTFVVAPSLGVEVPVDVDVNVGGGGGGGGTPPPGDVGNPGSPQSTGDGGEVEGTAPAGSVLVGLKVDILDTPVDPRTYAPGVYRGVAYIYMGTPAGLDQDFAGSMLRSGQFVYAEKENLTKWLVRANTGYNTRVTPYYREVD